jgi:hypothetical protein
VPQILSTYNFKSTGNDKREYQVNRYFRSHNIKARMKKKTTTPNNRENQIKKKNWGAVWTTVMVIHISRDLQQRHAQY